MFFIIEQIQEQLTDLEKIEYADHCADGEDYVIMSCKLSKMQ